MSSLKAKTLARLREQMRRLEKPDIAARPLLEFGAPAIDDALPAGGLAHGCLHEIAAVPGDAAAYGLVAWLLGRALGSGGVALWCRPQRSGRQALPCGPGPYGPGLARFGLAVERLILVRAQSPVEALWAMEESLRSGRFAVVLGDGFVPDLTATRRLQLAAEAGRAAALLLLEQTETSRARLSAATTRWRIAARPSERPERPRWQLALERCRGGGRGLWDVEWNHEALRLDIAAALADRPLAAPR